MRPIASIRAFEAVFPASASLISERAREQPRESQKPLWDCFAEGQVLELSGDAPGKLSVVTQLARRAQQSREVVAYVAPCGAPLPYAPDLAALDIDLAAFICVRMPESAGPHGLVRAAEVLLRSGAFGLVVLELGVAVPSGELTWQTRLSGLVRHHATRLILITASTSQSPSLGPLVSLRTEPRLAREARAHRVVVEQRVLKSKLGFHADPSPDVRRLPEGAV